jgi:hypothetical protein
MANILRRDVTDVMVLFKQTYENGEVVIFLPDSWREGSRSISTPRGRKFLKVCRMKEVIFVLMGTVYCKINTAEV